MPGFCGAARLKRGTHGLISNPAYTIPMGGGWGSEIHIGGGGGGGGGRGGPAGGGGGGGGARKLSDPLESSRILSEALGTSRVHHEWHEQSHEPWQEQSEEQSRRGARSGRPAVRPLEKSFQTMENAKRHSLSISTGDRVPLKIPMNRPFLRC